MGSKKSCFIIMPISTPESLVETYKGDDDHFKHVLQELFLPAIEAAGLKPIPPISKGSEVIHGDIIKNIETAEMLLCDMSALNANVFFELGMRTATNKPVALVNDKATSKVPFDLGIINHHTYSPELNAWEIKKEIEALTFHLKNCVENIDGGNALWNYFSVSAKAVPLEAGPNMEGQLALMNRQLEGLREELADLSSSRATSRLGRLLERESARRGESSLDAVIESSANREIHELAQLLGIEIRSIRYGPENVLVELKEAPDPLGGAEFGHRLISIAERFGLTAEIRWSEI